MLLRCRVTRKSDYHLRQFSLRRRLREDYEGGSTVKTHESLTDPQSAPAQAYWRDFANLQLGDRPESEYYASLLRISGDGASLAHVHLAHFHIIQGGRYKNRYLGSLLIQAYLRCEALEDARCWFDYMHDRTLYTWTFLITSYAQLGHGQDAFLLFNQMLHEGVLPDEHIFTNVISACGCELDPILGTQHHARVVGSGFDESIVVGNALVNLYGKCGRLLDARSTFDSMPRKNVITWTAIISAYVKLGKRDDAFTMFEQMQYEGIFPNRVTILTMMEACVSQDQAKFIHKVALQSGLDADVVAATALVTMYGRCSSPDCALSTFRSMRERTVVSWNATVAMCTENNLIKEALELFAEMLYNGIVPDSVSHINIVNALASRGEPLESKSFHHLIMQEGCDSVGDVATALIHMYGRCSYMEDALCIFNRLQDRTTVSWNYMMRVYCCAGEFMPAFQLFDQMKQECFLADKYVFSSILSACASKAAMNIGKWMHVFITGPGFVSDVVAMTALVNMYCKCGSLQNARGLFDSMTIRDLVCWNAMLDGYAQYGKSISDVIGFFHLMEKESVVPDSASFVSLISSCADLVELAEGQRFHACVVFRGFEAETAVATAVMNMYAKCGGIQEARQIFNEVLEHNEVSWTAMIAAYAQHGHGEEALDLFKQMLAAGFQPNEVTFVSVFTACRHAGLLDEGRRWWISMQRDYGIQPIADHYDCMIDLFSRVGQLDEAEDFLKKMPVNPTAISWMSLLSACRGNADVSRGTFAAEKILDFDSEDPSPYPILSNLSQAADREEPRIQVV